MVSSLTSVSRAAAKAANTRGSLVTTLTSVSRSAAKASAAREDLEDAIRAAKEDGHSLREIAWAANMSYETVRRICS